jgi:hypothetical protein
LIKDTTIPTEIKGQVGALLDKKNCWYLRGMSKTNFIIDILIASGDVSDNYFGF